MAKAKRKPRKDTWKSDPRANNHSIVLSSAFGKEIEVIDTRSSKGTHGQVNIGESDSNSHTREAYRQANDPFAVTLVTGTRAKSEISPLNAKQIVKASVNDYTRRIALEFGYEHDRAIVHAIYRFAERLNNTLDTLRSAKLANAQFLRTDCVDAVVEGVRKEINKANKVGLLAQDYYLDFMAHLLSHLPHSGSGYTTSTSNTIGTIANKWRNRIASIVDTGSASDCVTTSIGVAIDLLHLLDPMPEPDEPETGEGDGEPETTGKGDGESSSGKGDGEPETGESDKPEDEPVDWNDFEVDPEDLNEPESDESEEREKDEEPEKDCLLYTSDAADE